MKAAALVLLLMLGGCANVTAALSPPYNPQPIHIYKPDQYAIDLGECVAAGKAYVPPLNVGSTASTTAKGATSNSSMIPVSPLVPLYGAAGALLQALLDGFNIMSASHANVTRNCLHDETLIDGSAVLVNPN